MPLGPAASARSRTAGVGNGPDRRTNGLVPNHVNVGRILLDEAAMLAPGRMLPSLDAIHLASGSSIGADLRAVVTYDRRLADAAGALSLVVEAPA